MQQLSICLPEHQLIYLSEYLHTAAVDPQCNIHLGQDIDATHDDLVQVAVSHEVR